MEGNSLKNPFRPGAGQRPPVMAGRDQEELYFRRVLEQGYALQNILITGSDGCGKTVLLHSWRTIALQQGWLWAGNDISEAATLSEDHLAIRILTDLSHEVARIVAHTAETADGASGNGVGADSTLEEAHKFTFDALKGKYERAPGLPIDKLKSVLGRLSILLKQTGSKGIIFAYDESQRLRDHHDQGEFPLTMLMETFNTLQKQDGVAPCLFVLSGMPDTFESLTTTRTYAERMFHVVRLGRLSRQATGEALLGPLQPLMPPLRFSNELVNKTINLSRGQPYLIQVLGRSLVDAVLDAGGILATEEFPSEELFRHFETEMFVPRWNRATREQQKLLARIVNAGFSSTGEFSVGDLSGNPAEKSEVSPMQTQEILRELIELGLICRTREESYGLAVPMSEKMISRHSLLLLGSDAGKDAVDNSTPDEKPVSGEPGRWYRGIRMD